MLKQLTLYMHKVLVTKDDKSWKILTFWIVAFVYSSNEYPEKQMRPYQRRYFLTGKAGNS